jgi:hypothetical protein
MLNGSAGETLSELGIRCDVCCRMLPYADVCCRMLTYAEWERG